MVDLHLLLSTHFHLMKEKKQHVLLVQLNNDHLLRFGNLGDINTPIGRGRNALEID